jgi:RimJ/RimL family protein N-acetyltransferase
MLANDHADAIQRFASDVALARMLRIDNPSSPTVGTETVARLSAERVAGDAYWNVVIDQREVRGVSALSGPYTARPTVQVWIHPAWRRRGYGELAVRLCLELAFRNLQLAHVVTTADRSDRGQASLLARFGFAPDVPDPSVGPPANGLTEYSLTRGEWLAHRDRPALATLHPSLRAILEAELAAGNEVVKRVVGGRTLTACSSSSAIRSARSHRRSPPASFTPSLTTHTRGRPTTAPCRPATFSPADLTIAERVSLSSSPPTSRDSRFPIPDSRFPILVWPGFALWFVEPTCPRASFRYLFTSRAMTRRLIAAESASMTRVRVFETFELPARPLHSAALRAACPRRLRVRRDRGWRRADVLPRREDVHTAGSVVTFGPGEVHTGAPAADEG